MTNLATVPASREVQNCEAPAATVTAVAAATAIAGLRRQLRHQATFEHPAVDRELRKLEEQLAAQFELGCQAPGRHRIFASAAPD